MNKQNAPALPGEARHAAQADPLRVVGLCGVGRGPFHLTAAAGACVVVSGPSGVGKSLLLRMIADLDPNEGDVWLGAKPRNAVSGPAWRRQVMYVAAESGWWSDVVADHMEDAASARGLLPSLRLPSDILEAPVTRLSTGERQRLSLIRALVRRPRFLLLDEPTSALDRETTLAVEAVLMEEKRQGMGLVVVSHNPEQAERLADCRYHFEADGQLRMLAA